MLLSDQQKTIPHMNIEVVPIEEVIENPDNPRVIRDRKFKKLCKSIKDFPQMLEIRPIVVNEDMVVLGGNMRLAACRHVGLKKVHIMRASDLTPEQQAEFIIKDNVPFGEWNWDQLANEWNWDALIDWGVDVEIPQTEKQKEIDDNKKKIAEMEIQFNEHHDYIVFAFEDVNDFLRCISKLKISKMPDSLSPKAKTLGMGRVLNGKRLNEILYNQRESEPKVNESNLSE